MILNWEFRRASSQNEREMAEKNSFKTKIAIGDGNKVKTGEKKGAQRR